MVDCIQPLFIDFPVFNIADIVVTSGFVLLVLSMLMTEGREKTEEGEE